MDLAKESFFKLLTAVSVMCNFELDKLTVELYDSALRDIGYEQLTKGLHKIIVGRNSRDAFPSIKEIRDSTHDRPGSNKSLANDIAGRIISIVGKKGYTWNWGHARKGTFKDEFISECGDIAWCVVKSFGGYSRICEAIAQTDRGVFRAQLRDIALAKIEAGGDNSPPNFEQLTDGKFRSLGSLVNRNLLKEIK